VTGVQTCALPISINATGFGLTLGVHSRIDTTIDFVLAHAHVGNIYVNRNIIGAVVGVQPFGGEGQSGTGPKAGGPLYLQRLQRGAAPLPRAVPRSDAALDALRAWANAAGHHGLAERIDAYLAASLDGIVLDLPGPTGESNRLAFHARGTVLCVADTVPALLDQLAAVLATGNDALVPSGTHDGWLPNLPPLVRARVRTAGDGEIDAGAVAMALLDAPAQARWRTRLAERPDAIVGVVPAEGQDPVPLWRLVAERAVCINTTAAGGNASLMTLGL